MFPFYPFRSHLANCYFENKFCVKIDFFSFEPFFLSKSSFFSVCYPSSCFVYTPNTWTHVYSVCNFVHLTDMQSKQIRYTEMWAKRIICIQHYKVAVISLQATWFVGRCRVHSKQKIPHESFVDKNNQIIYGPFYL